MATNSSILPWEIPWTERILAGYSPRGHNRVGHDLATKQQQMLKLHLKNYIMLQMNDS